MNIMMSDDGVTFLSRSCKAEGSFGPVQELVADLLIMCVGHDCMFAPIEFADPGCI